MANETKIDQRSYVPLIWVITGIAACASITITGAFWVSTVDFRLERIEEKLGIPPYRAQLDIVPPAYAKKKEIYDHL